MGYDMSFRDGAETTDFPDGYFRLNIWGMGEYRNHMLVRGMVEWDSEIGEWPQAEDFKVSQEELLQWPEDDEEASPEFTAWREATEAIKGQDHGGVIAGYKLCSNDGWIVTPNEIGRALLQYELWKQQNGGEPLLTAESDMEEDEHGNKESYWQKWIEYLKAACDHGGVEVW